MFKIETTDDLEDKKEHNDFDSSEEILNEKKPNFPNSGEKYSHLKPEEKDFIEKYEEILKETISKAVKEIETKII